MKIYPQNIDILKRAFPHLDDKSKQSISVILKFSELNDTITGFLNQNQVSACDVNQSQVNYDELLKSIRPVCSKREKEIIDLVIGFTKSREIMAAYRSFSNEQSGVSAFDVLKNQLSPDQVQAINQLGKIINE